MSKRYVSKTFCLHFDFSREFFKVQDLIQNVMSSEEVGGLEAAALKRKERLAALREARNKKSSGTDGEKPLPA